MMHCNLSGIYMHVSEIHCAHDISTEKSLSDESRLLSFRVADTYGRRYVRN